ncbi:hypothetical protein L202_03329 [Cryptococcus amylolentus CBS 6039]|uniref:Uncharacterized protein n=1 Tax=Cryptococcus amylolentus CBS 6039 TaxID=1295533 RepID=A0A1E3HSI8_9TREE|nr:hypothetical protein L202_03329 [Cryptococcus amylolentus CBS 6039]ODN79320.1 hypothetical protein L202_03329 [Cryptococcus amylolentus CBS 6039]
MFDDNSEGWKDANQDSFKFYDPSTDTFTSSAPEGVPAFLSASSIAYGADVDKEILWPEQQEEQQLDPEEVVEARQRVAPLTTYWAEEVGRVREAAGIVAQNPVIQRQLSYLRSRPSRWVFFLARPNQYLCVDWMRKGSEWNRKFVSDYRDSRPSVNFTLVDVTQFNFWNSRAKLAAWAICRDSLGTSVPDTVMARMTESKADFDDSVSELNIEGVPELKPNNLPEAAPVRTIVESMDLNQGTLRDIQEGALEVVTVQQLEETRDGNATARRQYHEEGWADLNPDFQRLVGSWSESLEALRSANMTGLPPPL